MEALLNFVAGLIVWQASDHCHKDPLLLKQNRFCSVSFLFPSLDQL
jgi:hypothetical protein